MQKFQGINFEAGAKSTKKQQINIVALQNFLLYSSLSFDILLSHNTVYATDVHCMHLYTDHKHTCNFLYIQDNCS